MYIPTIPGTGPPDRKKAHSGFRLSDLPADRLKMGLFLPTRTGPLNSQVFFVLKSFFSQITCFTGLFFLRLTPWPGKPVPGGTPKKGLRRRNDRGGDTVLHEGYRQGVLRRRGGGKYPLFRLIRCCLFSRILEEGLSVGNFFLKYFFQNGKFFPGIFPEKSESLRAKRLGGFCATHLPVHSYETRIWPAGIR